MLGNTKGQHRARKWCLTLNNWTADEYDTITQVFLDKGWSYIIGKEVGEQGTPHLQMFVEHKYPFSFNTLKKINNRLHIEKAKGTSEDNFTYCSKENNFVSNMNMGNVMSIEEILLLEEYKDIEWYEWQQKLLNIINQKVDKRKVYWIVDEKGNSGKSFLCKYIAMKYDAILCSGKTGDIFNQVLGWRMANPKILQIPPCLIDVPRSEFSHVNYAAIEQLKNGCLYSGKYEGGKVFGKSPHAIIFANSWPNESAISADRWEIVEL